VGRAKLGIPFYDCKRSGMQTVHGHALRHTMHSCHCVVHACFLVNGRKRAHTDTIGAPPHRTPPKTLQATGPATGRDGTALCLWYL
jgi:hypothetical protein